MAMKFRLLHGKHSEGLYEGTETDAAGKPLKTIKPVVYRVGDFFNSKSDLTKHNRRGAIKFQPVDNFHNDIPLDFDGQLIKTEK